MADPSFDPTFDPNGAVRFDLKNGTASDAEGSRLLLVPSAAFEALDDETLGHVASHVGKACGARVASKLGGDGGVRGASLETVVSHLAGELALTGALSLHVERWGRAMVFVVAHPSVPKNAFVEPLLASALSAASGRNVFVAALEPSDGASRFFVGSEGATARVRSLVGSGRSYAEIIAKLQGSAS